MNPPTTCPIPQTAFIPSGSSGFTVRGLNILDSININKQHGIQSTVEGFARLRASIIAHACDELDAEENAFALPAEVSDMAIAAIIDLTKATMSITDSESAKSVVHDLLPETAH